VRSEVRKRQALHFGHDNGPCALDLSIFVPGELRAEDFSKLHALYDVVYLRCILRSFFNRSAGRRFSIIFRPQARQPLHTADRGTLRRECKSCSVHSTCQSHWSEDPPLSTFSLEPSAGHHLDQFFFFFFSSLIAPFLVIGCSTGYGSMWSRCGLAMRKAPPVRVGLASFLEGTIFSLDRLRFTALLFRSSF
jgi:hypothetical protein